MVVVTLILIITGFALTQYLVNLHRDIESSLAVRWFNRGEEAMEAHLPAVAADDFRTALSYNAEDREYRLRLAQALLAGNRLNEARAHLISLWEEEPADGEVNLTLARLFVRRSDYSKAVRYYSNAVNGVWSEQPRSQRIATRFELAEYLIQQNKGAQAQAELMALQADGPADPADQLLLAGMLLQVNEPKRALEAYQTVLSHDPKIAQAWLGKGQASLALGNYNEAEYDIANAVDRDPKLDDARRQLDLVREILRLDPAQRGLSLAERSKRAAESFQLAQQRLNTCATQLGFSLAAQSSPPAGGEPAQRAAASTPAAQQLQTLYATGLQIQPSATQHALIRNPDALDPTAQYVYNVERATAPVCPVTELADRALLTLAQSEVEPPK
ncbi:MAG TPA: tetratricopeptide repeat protein [Terriglobales bacterium]|nr:tetratricopeptide repeat protein [Terriglobales bacterium]